MRLIILTTQLWTTHKLAVELLKLMPMLGRLIDIHVRATAEEETTMRQMGVLFHIEEQQPITTSELAKKGRVSLQAASALVQGLVERGWLVRTPDPNDRRQFWLEITPEGLERAKTAREQLADYLAQFLEKLTPEEMAAAQVFLPGLQRVVHTKMASHPVEEDCDMQRS
jgi:DNA-binding MarR family transcriptional regulator